MSLSNLIAEVEQMSQEEKKALLETQFSEDLSKEAEAAVDAMGLAEACYQYGALQAERAVAEADGLDKVASETLESHEAAVGDVGEAIDAHLENLGVAEMDELEMHKQAQAAAGFIFEGYSDQLEKLAAMKELKGAVKKVLHSAHGKMKAAGKHIAKHKGKYAAGAGAVAAGAYGSKKLMEKKASDATIGDIIEAIDARDAHFDEVAELQQGVEKLAAKGASKAAELMKKLKSAPKEMGKHLKKHKGIYAAGAGGLAAGGVAGRMSKKDGDRD